MTLLDQLREHDHWFLIAKGFEAGVLMSYLVWRITTEVKAWRMRRATYARRLKRWDE
jgi:hypothetical protein